MTAKKSPAARKTSRSTRTKAELEEEIEQLESRLEGAPELSPLAQTLAKEHIKEVRSAVKGSTPEAIIAEGAQLGFLMQKTVTDLTTKIAALDIKVKEYEEAITIEEAELARLYDLDVASASVKALIEEHEAKKQELEGEIIQSRNNWNEEVQAHGKAIQIRNQELLQARNREQDEYTYKNNQARTKANDEFAQQMLLQNRQQADRVEAVNKDLAVRLEAIMAQEKELTAFKARVEGLDEEIKQKSARDVAIATSSLKKDLTNEFLMQKKDLELEIRVSNEKNASINQANVVLSQQVVQLGLQLEAARDQVRFISEKALESASGQVALSAVRETVKDNGAQGGGRKS